MTDTVQHYLCQSTTPPQPLTQTPDTSETSMVEPKPDDPLKVGDWVELRSKPGDGCYEPRTLELSKLPWPRKITTIGRDGYYVKPHGYNRWCNPQRFRRVPPPSTIAAEQDRIADSWQYRFRNKCGLLYRGNDSGVFFFDPDKAWTPSMYTNWQACINDPDTSPCDEHGNVKTEHAERTPDQDRIAELTRERDELRQQLDTWLEIDKGIREIFSYEHDEMLDLTTFVAQDVGELRHQLATVQAEAAAMRKALEWYREQVRRSYECKGAGQRIAEQKLIDDAIEAREDRDVAGKALNATAGRELLDDMRRKDEGIAELERERDELQRQLAEVTRERDRYSQAFCKALSCVDRAFQPHSKPEAILPEFCRLGEDKFEAVPKLATAYKQASEKLAEVTRERDELDATNKSMSRLNVNAVAYTEKVERKLAQAREQLATVQAEAAAMRPHVEALRNDLLQEVDPEYGHTEAQRSIISRLNEINACLSGTAGRDLLDEMRRKDERIAELEKRSDEWETWYLDMQDRAKRKCRTAKAELIEARERIAELSRQLAEHAPLVAIALDLRELLTDVDPLDAVADVRIVVKEEEDGEKLMGLLKKLRDAKGGE